MSAETPPRLSMKGVEKRFGAVAALRGADFDLCEGEIHALFGANGAGKSTLSKIITGHISPSAGRMTLNGAPVAFSRPRDAIGAGIGIVTQETALAPDLAVWENILLHAYGGRWRRRGALRDQAAAALEALGFSGEIPLDQTCAALSAAQRQMVEIARAVALGGRIIIFDEPTAALSPSETARLFAIMEKFRAEGRSMVFVSHRLEEIFALTDRITVLRDGRSMANNIRTSDIDPAELIRLMVGRSIAPLTATGGAARSAGPVALSVEDLGDGGAVRSVSFEAHEGEILGLGGLVGSGRSETAELIMGLRRSAQGRMRFRGQPWAPDNPAQALGAGMGFLPEDRARQSIIPDLSVRENILLSHISQLRGPRLGYGRHEARIRELATLIELPLDRLDDESLLNFSGGMQQKALILRALLLAPKMLVLDEPTKGVDIGSRATIYDLLRRLAAEGMAILLISSDFEELLALAHRIVPISDGRTIGSVPAADLDEEKLLLLSAPRSSLAAQRRMLSELEAHAGAAAVWMIPAGERAVCVAASPSAERLMPTGGAPAIAASPFAAAFAAGGALTAESDGRRAVVWPLSNPRGHDMGRLGVSWPPEARPDPDKARAFLEERFRTEFEGQFRLDPVHQGGLE